MSHTRRLSASGSRTFRKRTATAVVVVAAVRLPFQELLRRSAFTHSLCKARHSISSSTGNSSFPNLKRYGLEGGESMNLALDTIFCRSSSVQGSYFGILIRVDFCSVELDTSQCAAHRAHRVIRHIPKEYKNLAAFKMLIGEHFQPRYRRQSQPRLRRPPIWTYLFLRSDQSKRRPCRSARILQGSRICSHSPHRHSLHLRLCCCCCSQ